MFDYVTPEPEGEMEKTPQKISSAIISTTLVSNDLTLHSVVKMLTIHIIVFT